MMLPGERDLRAEREAIVSTMQSLSPAEFETAPTLCDGWAPRDILAHVMGVDRALPEYLRAGGWVNTGNELVVRKWRALPREELLERAENWKSNPAPWTRTVAPLLLGDNAIHHADVLRPLGRTRVFPPASRAAMLREGMLLGARRLLDHRIEPTDGGRALGRGTTVRGTAEALSMWLAGRDAYAADLEFTA